jgi:hypothetical protein
MRRKRKEREKCITESWPRRARARRPWRADRGENGGRGRFPQQEMVRTAREETQRADEADCEVERVAVEQVR